MRQIPATASTSREHVQYCVGDEVVDAALRPLRERPLISPLDEYNQHLIANAHPSDWVNPTPGGPYNLVVIGGGSAGLLAAVAGAGLGAKVAVIERHLLGGDCLNYGCVPSKSVIRSSRAVGDIALARETGVYTAGDVTVDFDAVMRRMRKIRARISNHDSVHRFSREGIDVYLGEGRFAGPDTIEVAGQILHFKKALIATGSRPTHPAIPGLQEAGFLTNETLFELTERPRRLAVIGGGPIGCEMAQAFQRFGSDVTILEKGERVLPRDDEAASALVMQVFRREGVHLLMRAKVTRIERNANGKLVYYEQDGQTQQLEVDELLVAVGRTVNIETLNLEAAGIAYDRDGVTVDATLRTSNRNVYAAGDVALKYKFTHTADATARVALQNALFPIVKKKVSDLVVPWCTYTDPEVAHVRRYSGGGGDRDGQVDTYEQVIGETDRGQTDGDDEGFVKVHVRKGTDDIVGATIVARHAGEMINEITLVMVQGAGLKSLVNVIHPYPTQAEAIRKVADKYNRSRLTPIVKRVLNVWFGWTRG